MTVIGLSVAWLAGILAAAATPLTWQAWLGSGLAWSLATGPLRFRPFMRRMALCAAFFCFGGMRLVLAQPSLDESHIAYYNGAESVVTGVVTAEPELRGASQRVTVAAEAITLSVGATRPVTGKLLVTIPRYPGIPYGTRLRLAGRLEEPPVFEAFDYRDYLARRGIRTVMRPTSAAVVAEGAGEPWRAALLAFKARAQASINRLLPEPGASLLSGILLGNDSGLPDDLQTAFRATGMSHIIAISGFNISLLAGGLTRLATPFVGRRRSAWIALAGIGAYTALVGADAAVVRAAVMGGLYLTGNRLLGRPIYALGSLFSAALLMTAINPFNLWEVGFQLSFAATLGLMVYADRFNRWTEARLARRLPSRFIGPVMAFLSDSVLVTFAAQLATLPLMLAVFDQVSVVSLVANPLILPAQPGVMLLGGLATCLGMVAPGLAQPVAWVAWLLLDYTITLVAWFGALPWAAVPAALGPGGAVALYAAISGATWWLLRPADERREMRDRWVLRVPAATVAGLSLAIAILAVGWGRSQPDALLHMSFMPARLGNALLIRTPTGRTLLVHRGMGDPYLGGTSFPSEVLPFWQRRLDVVILPAVSDSGISGVLELVERYRVGRLILPAVERSSASALEHSHAPALEALLTAAATQGTEITTALGGEVIRVGDGLMVAVASTDDGSLVLRMAFGELSVALERETGEWATVLVDGGAGSMPAASGAQVVLRTGTRADGNTGGHSNVSTLERAIDAGMDAPVLDAGTLGAVELVSDGRVMWWWAHRPRSSAGLAQADG